MCQVRTISVRAPDQGLFFQCRWSHGQCHGERKPWWAGLLWLERSTLGSTAECRESRGIVENTPLWDIPFFKSLSYNAGTRMGNALSQASCCQSKKWSNILPHGAGVGPERSRSRAGPWAGAAPPAHGHSASSSSSGFIFNPATQRDGERKRRVLPWVEVQRALFSHYGHCVAIMDNYNLTSHFFFFFLKTTQKHWSQKLLGDNLGDVCCSSWVYFILWGIEGTAVEMPDIKNSLYFCLQNRS